MNYPMELMTGSCEGETDDRYTESGYQTDERFLMEKSGVLNNFGSAPNFYAYLNYQTLEANALKTWNRPTASWLLSCEHSDKTRLAAIDKTAITLEISAQHEHIGNCGLALIIMLPLMCICPMVCILCNGVSLGEFVVQVVLLH